MDLDIYGCQKFSNGNIQYGLYMVQASANVSAYSSPL